MRPNGKCRFKSLFIARLWEKTARKDTGREYPEAAPNRLVEDILAGRRGGRSLQPAAIERRL